jgi:hypothetical protein
MDKKEEIALDNKTIAKLAIAIADAIQLRENGEVIGPLTRKVVETLDTIDSLEHFAGYSPKGRL